VAVVARLRDHEFRGEEGGSLVEMGKKNNLVEE